MKKPETIEEFLEVKARERSEDFRRVASGETSAEAMQEENSLWPKHATSVVDYAEYARRLKGRGLNIINSPTSPHKINSGWCRLLEWDGQVLSILNTTNFDS